MKSPDRKLSILMNNVDNYDCQYHVFITWLIILKVKRHFYNRMWPIWLIKQIYVF